MQLPRNGTPTPELLATLRERRRDDAGELAGPVHGGHLPAVLQHDQQVVAPGQSEIAQAGRCSTDLAGPPRVAQASFAIDDGNGVAAALDALQEGSSEIEHGGLKR